MHEISRLAGKIMSKCFQNKPKIRQKRYKDRNRRNQKVYEALKDNSISKDKHKSYDLTNHQSLTLNLTYLFQF